MKNLFYCVFLFCLASTPSYGQDFIYTPVNPAFGGNVLNGWMLNSANTQNKIQNPDNDSNRRNDPVEQFTESLNRQILNQISRQLINDQFGQEGLTEGTYQFGDFQVEVTPGIDGLVILITDFATGGQTSVTVPFF
ncbi:MAG: curli production assembly/transport component CsgF [Bacteroidetes bacterium]|nr:MAG: curli production assembly/transport component CsgF [Bacteroidota bacterium]